MTLAPELCDVAEPLKTESSKPVVAVCPRRLRGGSPVKVGASTRDASRVGIVQLEGRARPSLPFKNGPVNGRDARDTGLWLKAEDDRDGAFQQRPANASVRPGTVLRWLVENSLNRKGRKAGLRRGQPLSPTFPCSDAFGRVQVANLKGIASMPTVNENGKPATQPVEIDDFVPLDDAPPTVRTVKIERDAKEEELAFVKIKVQTSVTMTTFEFGVDVKASGTMGDAEQAAYRMLVKHLDEAKELAQSLILTP
jgi:hypothetical protein